jgi:hypothetical protein
MNRTWAVRFNFLRGGKPLVRIKLLATAGVIGAAILIYAPFGQAQSDAGDFTQTIHGVNGNPLLDYLKGKILFERETFRGNGRTCQTCHSQETGTVSPQDAQKRLKRNPKDPLFVHDGSDDGHGNGVQRMLKDATFLVEIKLPPNVSLAKDPNARTVTLRRGVPSTLNTPALDPVLMLDGRDPNLETQASNAIRSHYQGLDDPSSDDLRLIAGFQKSFEFFSSFELWRFARGGPDPELPRGRTESEKRGRRFFEDAAGDPFTKIGICAACHSGPMLNQTNQFLPTPKPLPPGSRFQSILVSELNAAGNEVLDFIFKNPDGTTTLISSPDPGRALITGDSRNDSFDNVNAFKIPSLWGVKQTAPYFHDNSAKTLEDVVVHYDKFFNLVTGGVLRLTPQDQADIVAYMKLLK